MKLFESYLKIGIIVTGILPFPSTQRQVRIQIGSELATLRLLLALQHIRGLLTKVTAKLDAGAQQNFETRPKTFSISCLRF